MKHITVYGPLPNSRWPLVNAGILVDDEKADNDTVSYRRLEDGPAEWAATEYWLDMPSPNGHAALDLDWDLENALYSVPLPDVVSS